MHVQATDNVGMLHGIGIMMKIVHSALSAPSEIKCLVKAKKQFHAGLLAVFQLSSQAK